MNIASACFKYISAETFLQDLALLAGKLYASGHRITLCSRLIETGTILPDHINVKIQPGAHWGNAPGAGKFIRTRCEVLNVSLPDILVAFDRIPGADLLLHPAGGEAGGTAPFETLYAGVPMRTASSGSRTREIVEAVSMLIPAPFRQAAFSRALRLLLSTPSKREKMTRELLAVGTVREAERRFEAAADIITGKITR